MSYLSKVTIETAEELETYIQFLTRHGWVKKSDLEILQGFLPDMTVTDDTLFTVDGQLVPNARLIVQQGFHYPYDPVQVWRIGAKGEKPTWVTAFPKRKATMTKKGYLEGTLTFTVTLEIEVPFTGDLVILVHRQGEPIKVVTDRWAE